MTRGLLSPPRLPRLLLQCVLPSYELQYVLGDLEEEYVLVARSVSVPAASAWYWMQICRSAPVLVRTSVARVGRIRTIGIAVLIYAAASLLEALGTAGLTLLPLDSMTFQVANTVVGLSAILAAGYVAARIQPSTVPVLALMVLTIVIVLMATTDGPPLWYELAFLIGGPLVALGGAVPAFRHPFSNFRNSDSS